jgi:HD-GYP domain-containing protein (c-di-GMP phosphodiesterase class II)
MQSLSTKRFIAAILAAAFVAVVFVAYIAPGFDRATVVAAAFFALVGILGYALAYQLPRGGSGNISFIPFLSGLAVAPGLPLVFAVMLAVTCGEIVQRREGLKAMFNVAQYTLAIALALCVFVWLGGKPIDAATWARSVVPFAAAFATWLFVNSAAVSGVMALSQHRPLWEIWKQNTQAIRYDILALPFVYGFGYVYTQSGWWALGVALPLFGLRQLYKTNWQLETINEELLQLMVAAIEARDPYTSGHSRRVAQYSRIVGRAAGLSARAVDRLATAALLHDVGKIHEEFAPILRKPGRLTADEFAIMRSHPEKGAILVAKVTQFRDLVPAIRGHHESWDGMGYPDRLSGDEIPLWARVISFADTIDAMTTDRPYREALDPSSVQVEITAQSGRQFDPRIAGQLTSVKIWEQMDHAIRTNHVLLGKREPMSGTLPHRSESAPTAVR